MVFPGQTHEPWLHLASSPTKEDTTVPRVERQEKTRPHVDEQHQSAIAGQMSRAERKHAFSEGLSLREEERISTDKGSSEDASASTKKGRPRIQYAR